MRNIFEYIFRFPVWIVQFVSKFLEKKGDKYQTYNPSVDSKRTKLKQLSQKYKGKKLSGKSKAFKRETKLNLKWTD